MKNINQTVGRFLKTARLNQNLTLQELSDLTNIRPSQICKVEQGYNSCTMNTISKLLDALKLEIVFKPIK